MDQLLLLALRCLVLLALAFLLSEPLFRNRDTTATLQKVHLVQPDDFVVDNYRFELEKARERGEAIYWLSPELPKVEELSPPTERTTPNQVLIQNALNRLNADDSEVHLYLKNERMAYLLPTVQTPTHFQLHAAADTLGRKVRDYRSLADNQKLYVGADNRLRTAAVDAAVTFAAQPAGQGALKARIDLKNPLERKTAEAALQAFAEVYGLALNREEEANAERPNDLVFSDKIPAALNPATLYIVTGQNGLSAFPNVVYFPGTLTPQTSPLVASGQLPEWLGQRILDHWKIKGDPVPMSREELSGLFARSTRPSGQSSAATQQIIFIFLLVLVILERTIALKRNA